MPEKKFSTGAVSATIWKNQVISKKTGEQVEFRTIQLDRRYKDKEDNWKSTNSFRINDLPKVSLVVQKAYEYLVLRDIKLGENTTAKGENIEVEDVVM